MHYSNYILFPFHTVYLGYPLLKDTLCQALLKLAQWFWRGRLLYVVNIFSVLFHYLPFGRDVALYLNKLEFPSLTNLIVVLSLVEIQRRSKCEKFTDRRKDLRKAGRQRSGDQKSSGELKNLNYILASTCNMYYNKCCHSYVVL